MPYSTIVSGGEAVVASESKQSSVRLGSATMSFTRRSVQREPEMYARLRHVLRKVCTRRYVFAEGRAG